jgi:zinc transport system substrate-binding protein
MFGCTPGSSSIDSTTDNADNIKIKIATSFYPLAYFAQQVVGDWGEVTSLTPTGTEPHAFEPSAKAVASVYESDLFLFNGAGVDAWAGALEEDLELAGVKVIEMTRYFELKKLAEEESAGEEDVDEKDGDERGYDPHIWTDPVLAKKQIEVIRDALISLDPEHALTYQTNASETIAKLSVLDAEFQGTLASCAQDTIIVAHDAFQYPADRYRINIISIAGLSPESEPSAQKLAELTDLAKQYGIKIIFFEELASPKLAQTLAEEVGATTLVLNPLEGLTEDQLAAGENYFSLMKKNLNNLSLALECQ